MPVRRADDDSLMPSGGPLSVIGSLEDLSFGDGLVCGATVRHG